MKIKKSLLLIFMVSFQCYSWSQTVDTVLKTGCISGNCEEGYGIMVWDNGARYEGNWKRWSPHGKGKNIYESGAVYDGEWKYGQCNGHGIYYNKNGILEYDGFWENNKRVAYTVVNEKTEDRTPKPTYSLNLGLIEVMMDYPNDFKNITGGFTPDKYDVVHYSTVNPPHCDSATISMDTTFQMVWEVVVLKTENKDSALNKYHETVTKINEFKHYPVSFGDGYEVVNDEHGGGVHIYETFWLSMPLTEETKKYEHMLLMVKEQRDFGNTCYVTVSVTRNEKKK